MHICRQNQTKTASLPVNSKLLVLNSAIISFGNDPVKGCEPFALAGIFDMNRPVSNFLGECLLDQDRDSINYHGSCRLRHYFHIVPSFQVDRLLSDLKRRVVA